MKKLILYSFLTLTFYSINAQTYVWTQKTDFGGGDRFASFYFSIGNKGYVGSGVTFSGTTYEYTHMDFWEYDGSLDAWTQKADVPDTCVSGAAGFSIGNKGYISTGWTPVPVNTTYEYDPSTNSWSQKANFAGSPRYSTSYFSIDSFAYVGMGYAPSSTDFWKYDPLNDSWTQVADVGGSARSAASSFSLDGYGYVFGGTMALNAVTNELWQYDPSGNQWTQKTSMPGPGRHGAAAFTMNGLGFVGLGNDLSNIYNDFYSYNPVTDSWIQIASVPFSGRYAGYSLSFANACFVGGGAASIVPTANLAHDLWRLELLDANTISGKLYYDFNNNLAQDAGEPPISNKLISETTSGRIAFSGIDGSYNLAVLDSGNFTVTTDSSGYFAPTPASHNLYFNSLNNIDSLNDFAFEASAVINDLCITISPLGNFRAGFDAYYNISYQNYGTTIQNPTVIFFIDTNVVFTSASVTPTSTTTDSVVWNLPPLSPFQTGSINVVVTVDVSTPIGTLIVCPVVIEPVAGDVNPACNYFSWEVLTTGSFDPNDILVNRDELTTTEITNQPYLDYVIRFQNTGNDTAFTVDVINPVPENVELNTFEFVAASHQALIRHESAFNSLGFRFNNILLPDSNVNELESHGFIHYRIKPKNTLVLGDIIENNAAIYFDFNAPVLTNTAITTVVSPLSVPSISNKAHLFDIYPNPNMGIFNIVFNSLIGEEAVLNILNVVGQNVLSEKINITPGVNKLSFDKRSLKSGIYFIRLKTAEKTVVEKLVLR